ncbi:unnamed protein product, partial [Allacma fusca]
VDSEVVSIIIVTGQNNLKVIWWIVP